MSAIALSILGQTDLKTLTVSILLIISLSALSAEKQEIRSSNCANNLQNITDSPINIYCQLPPPTTIQDAYLIATHPTTLTLESMDFSNTIYDGNREFLAATIKNVSELPALNTKTSLAIEVPGSPIADSKVIKTEKSRFYAAAGGNGIKISKGQSIALPLVSVRDINTLITAKYIPEGYCLYDASVTHSRQLQSNRANTQLRETRSLMLRVKVEYKTIFKEKNTNYVAFFVNYAKEKQPGMVWYSSRNEIDNLTCLNTGRYF